MTYQGREYTKAELAMMTDWIKDCLGIWTELDSEDAVDELSDTQVLNGIQRHYSGGLVQFLKDGQ